MHGQCCVWALVLVLACARELSAVGGRAAFRLFGEQEGLVNTSVERLLQDDEGFLWIGTEDGLFRFDGRTFTRFGHEDGLPSGRIDDLFESSRGTLFVGTRAGLAKRAGDGFVTLGAEHGLPAAPVSDRGIVESRAGEIFVATQKGLFTGDGERFSELRLSHTEGETLVGALFLARDGALLFSRGRRLMRLDERREEDFGSARGLSTAEQIDEVVEDGGGRLWVRTLSELWVLAPGAGRFERADAGVPAAISTGRIDVDARGEVMLPTVRGLVVRSGDAWHLLGAAEGLPAPTALSSLVDREGTLWVGLAGAGLAQRLGSGALTTFTITDGLSNDVVWGIAQARETAGKSAPPPLWIATQDGLSRVDRAAGGEVSSISPVAGTHGTFYAVAPDPDGSVWAGAWPGGVTRFGPEPGRIRHYGARGHDAAEFKVIALRIRGADVWAGASDGVYRLAPDGVFAPQATPGGEAPDSVYAFAEWQGELWCAGRFGLQRLTGPAPRRFRARDGLRSDFLASLVALPDGTLWAGYREALGVERLRWTDGRLETRQLTRAQGLGSDKVLFLGADPRDRIWIGTPSGVDLFSPEGLRLRHLGRADGLPTEDMDQNAFYAGDRDTAWLGSSRGLVRFAASSVEAAAPPPPILLTEAWSGSRRLRLGSAIELPAGERNLLVRWAGLTFVDSGRVRFRYRLAGLEDAETETSVPEARFPALPSGTYRLEVVAISAAGKQSPSPATLDVRVAPRWWERGSARLLFVLLGAGVIAAIVALRTRELERDRRRLETAVAERSEELAGALRAVEELSFTDPLTKARNRRFFAAAIEREIARATRDRSSGRPAADCGLLFLLVDLDHFKEVNDRFGHAAGDRVLVESARRIAGACRESDLLVRWGGEEFLVVAPEAGPERGQVLAQRVLAAFRAEPFALDDGSSLQRSCSIGWTSFPWTAESEASLGWEPLVHLADRALYVAKKEGRNRAVGILAGTDGHSPDGEEEALSALEGRAIRLVRSTSTAAL